MDNVVYANDVSKAFGPTLALNSVSVAVQRGEVFGVLGPNGAGKTTLIDVLVGLQRADTGVVSMLGHAMPRGAEQVRRFIGVMPQAQNLPPLLRVSELLSIYELLYPHGEGADALLDRIGLLQQRRTLISKLSAGQKQRLALALALIAKPELLILDEPTTALDPQSRRFVWNQVRDAQERGSTTLLTTHSMEEAQSLCDRVMIMDRGRTLDLGSPRDLIEKHCPGYRISIACAPSDRPVLQDAWGDQVTWGEQDEAVVSAGEVAHVVDVLSRVASKEGRQAPSITSVEHNNLEDVYLSLTGRELRN